MSTTEPTLWNLEPHTKAKHDILTYYLKAWFPAQSGTPRRLLYIDGFAGPGEYIGGEPGSPILAIDVILKHKFYQRLTRPGMELVLLFIESSKPRFANLEHHLSKYTFDANLRVEPVNATFEEYLDKNLNDLERRHLVLAPSLTFIDPFGPTGFPIALIKRISQHPRSEVLINFSYQSLNQWFLNDPSKHKRLDELFGDDRWCSALQISNPREKELFLVQSYKAALEQQGWRGLNFKMINNHNQTQYHLMFGSKHYLGMLLMKRAMWSVAPDGDFRYSDFSNVRQTRLFASTSDEFYAGELAELIWKNRRGTTVQKQDLLQTETAYHPICLARHLTRALQILEYDSNPPRIVSVTKRDRSKRKTNTYPDGCSIQFAG